MKKLDLSYYRANEMKAHRQHGEPPETIRSKFERDRDRILYSREFRRLSGKTQVFVTGFDDQARTRLTHTLEVAQIAMTIAHHCSLDVALTQAIAFGHDIGHTPFGHVGERTLNFLMNGCLPISREWLKDEKTFGFKHNLQSLKVVDVLERISRKYAGLNLTDHCRWGIVHHSDIAWPDCKLASSEHVVNKQALKTNYICTLDDRKLGCHLAECAPDQPPGHSLSHYSDLLNQLGEKCWSIEGVIVRYADEVAQRNHDLEDGLRSRILAKGEAINMLVATFGSSINSKIIDLAKKEESIEYYLPMLSRAIVSMYVKAYIRGLGQGINTISARHKINSPESFQAAKPGIGKELGTALFRTLSWSDNFAEKDRRFHTFLRDRIIKSHLAQSMDGKSTFIIRKLIKAYLNNPQQLPDATIIRIFSNMGDFDFKKLEQKSLAKTVGEYRNRLDEHHNSHSDVKYRTSLIRTICDYISGMTDSYAMRQYHMLYGSTPWNH